MNKISTLFLLLTLISTSVFAGDPPKAVEWKNATNLFDGTLTYRDYSSDKLVTLEMVGYYKSGDSNMEMRMFFAEWKGVIEHNYKFKFNGNKVTGEGSWDIISDTVDPETGAKIWVGESKGKDGNQSRPCTFRMTLTYGQDQIVMRKEVKFDDEEAFFMRNEYKMVKK